MPSIRSATYSATTGAAIPNFIYVPEHDEDYSIEESLYEDDPQTNHRSTCSGSKESLQDTFTPNTNNLELPEGASLLPNDTSYYRSSVSYPFNKAKSPVTRLYETSLDLTKCLDAIE